MEPTWLIEPIKPFQYRKGCLQTIPFQGRSRALWTRIFTLHHEYENLLSLNLLNDDRDDAHAYAHGHVYAHGHACGCDQDHLETQTSCTCWHACCLNNIHTYDPPCRPLRSNLCSNIGAWLDCVKWNNRAKDGIPCLRRDIIIINNKLLRIVPHLQNAKVG